VGEEQGPWWTQPPTPSPPPATTPDQGADGESRAARFRARVRRMQDAATGEVPTPRGAGPGAPVAHDARDAGPDGGAWQLPQFQPPAPPAPPGAGPATGPMTERYPAASSLASPPQPPGAVPPASPPPAEPGQERVVDLRRYEDPHDPLNGAWSQAPPAAYPAGPGDATERLPRVGGMGAGQGPDDALGVYGTPSRVAPGIPGLTGDADPVGHLRGMPGGRRLPEPVARLLGNLPGRDRLPRLPADGRTVAIVGGVVAVLLVVLVVRLLTGGGDDAPPPVAQTSTGQNAAAAGQPKDFAKVGTAAAVKDLRRAGEARGDVVGAWRWSDENGRNLLATTRERSGANQTLRVIHVARLDKDPKTLRVMIDPGLPGCQSGGGTAGFTKNSVQVRDLDRDGIAEVLVGWFARCGSAAADSTVKLAVLSDGDKYILRGQGVVGSGGSQAPDPAAKSWPKPFLKAATAVFKTLYF
jgi:hypothetical protein